MPASGLTAYIYMYKIYNIFVLLPCEENLSSISFMDQNSVEKTKHIKLGHTCGSQGSWY